MSANEQKIGHFWIDLQRTTKTTEHTDSQIAVYYHPCNQNTNKHFRPLKQEETKTETSFFLQTGRSPLRVCFKSSNLVPTVFSLSNMAAAGEKTLAHSELKRSLIGAFHGEFIRALSLVYSFQKQRLWLFEGFVETEKCFLQSLRPKKWTEFRSDCMFLNY